VKRIVLAAILLFAIAQTATAQSKTITGDTKTITGTIESIERSSRELTLKKDNGEFVTMTVPKEATKFDTLKVGDKVTLKYYENLVLRMKEQGETAVDTGGEATTASGAAKAGGTQASQRTITATITQIDPSVPSITFTGPNGWTYSSRVYDKEALSKVKVGDRVDITWTQAVLASVETPAKK
jgi:Cu/Ag efflux protein CusF